MKGERTFLRTFKKMENGKSTLCKAEWPFCEEKLVVEECRRTRTRGGERKGRNNLFANI
jgi:hypothetical protein